MDYRQARLELKKGKLRPLYLFVGAEETLKEELLGIMLELLAQKGAAPDLLRIDGKKVPWRELLQEVAQLTIFGRGRVLLVKDAPYFGSETKKKAAAGDGGEPLPGKSGSRDDLPTEAWLASVLAAGLEETLLIFSVPEVDRRRKLIKYLEAQGVLVDFPPLKGAALARWARDELKKGDKEIDAAALALLLERSGENLDLLRRELDKLLLFLEHGRRIESSHVEMLVSENLQGDVFSLVDELGKKNAVAALYHFHKIRRRNEPPLRILALIIRHFRLLYRARLLQEQGLAPGKMAAALQVPPFVAARLQEQLTNFPAASLPYLLAELKEVDLRIKTGRLPGEEALEQLIYSVVFEPLEEKISARKKP